MSIITETAALLLPLAYCFQAVRIHESGDAAPKEDARPAHPSPWRHKSTTMYRSIPTSALYNKRLSATEVLTAAVASAAQV